MGESPLKYFQGGCNPANISQLYPLSRFALQRFLNTIGLYYIKQRINISETLIPAKNWCMTCFLNIRNRRKYLNIAEFGNYLKASTRYLVYSF